MQEKNNSLPVYLPALNIVCWVTVLFRDDTVCG